MEKLCLRFKDVSISEKMLYSLFLLTIGIGYLIALTHMYYTHQMRDGKPGMSIEDVRIAYYGSDEQTRLGSAINGGPMEVNLKSAADKEKILTWLTSGKHPDNFKSDIAPILNRDCVGCHTPQINAGLPNLTTYEGVMEVASSKAAPLPGLVKVSHIHLFGIAFILLFVGRIFIYCEMNTAVKRIVIIIPFVSMLIDTLSWFITRSHPGFAYVVVASGAMMGLSMGVQIVISLYQMWCDSPCFTLSNEQRIQLKKYRSTAENLALKLATISKEFVLTMTPIVWKNSVDVFQSLLQIVQYASQSNRTVSSINDLKAQDCTQDLKSKGYAVYAIRKGFWIQQSLWSWLFVSSVEDLERYLANLPLK